MLLLLENFVGFLATAICVVSYLSNVQPHITVRRTRQRVNEYGSNIVVTHWHMFNALFYGYLILDVFLVLTSGVGLISTLFYLLTLLYYGSDPMYMEYTLISFYMFALAFFTVYTFVLPTEYRFQSVQILNITSNLFCSLFLLQPIIASFRTKVNFNPKYYTYFNTVNICLWTLYGFLKKDVVLFYPHLVQGLLRFIQCWQVYYYSPVTTSETNIESPSVVDPDVHVQSEVAFDDADALSIIERSISTVSLSMLEESDFGYASAVVKV
ncbi:hypothetical protein GEMRC1_006113 [Eukaryota sp. GEM-RC1]